ncbi:hypothetical protein PVAP13_8KG120200 [Panicum virgatum]|uniref:Uncharacterized protein n=1 Tax=Panicum virgatum TaxID=38727 RepID=A0A8T0PVX9_PANVG|nr:hypothetical protein PVAP13_8KG120200 [Panicum virgatum]
MSSGPRRVSRGRSLSYPQRKLRGRATAFPKPTAASKDAVQVRDTYHWHPSMAWLLERAKLGGRTADGHNPLRSSCSPASYGSSAEKLLSASRISNSYVSLIPSFFRAVTAFPFI